MKTSINFAQNRNFPETQIAADLALLPGDCSCLPLFPEQTAGSSKRPFGFLVLRNNEWTFLDAHTPEGERLSKNHPAPGAVGQEATPALPAEYWYG